MADIREIRITFPPGEKPLVSLEVAADGRAQYVQAQFGGEDVPVILPGETEPVSVWATVAEAFNRALAERIVTPWAELGEPPGEPPVHQREEEVWIGGELVRRSLSMFHPDAEPLREMLKQMVQVPGVVPLGRVIFVGTTEAGRWYSAPTLNVYYSGAVPAETWAHFGAQDWAGRNLSYYGIKVLRDSGAVALRLLDHNIEEYLPIPVPAWVTLPDLRFGIARHFGAHSTDTLDLYFQTDRHADVATWCAEIGHPAPKSDLTGSRTYGVTWNRGTGQVTKVKVYLWSQTFEKLLPTHNAAWTQAMLQRWKRPTLALR